MSASAGRDVVSTGLRGAAYLALGALLAAGCEPRVPAPAPGAGPSTPSAPASRPAASPGTTSPSASSAASSAESGRDDPLPAPQHLAAVELVVGLQRIEAEVAKSDLERQRGLMSRTDIAGTDRGMLFVFPRAKVLRFWMKNTPTPLSIAYLDDDGTILEIDDMRPFDLEGAMSSRPARLALEMAQGWFDRRGVKPGDRIFGLDRVGGALD